jgi:hypothetical protein
MNESKKVAGNQSDIDNLVTKIIQIYHEEDYDYVVSLAKKGQRAEAGIRTIEDEIEFIESNNLNSEGLSHDDLKIVAKIVMDKIWDIDNDVYYKYNHK